MGGHRSDLLWLHEHGSLHKDNRTRLRRPTVQELLEASLLYRAEHQLARLCRWRVACVPRVLPMLRVPVSGRYLSCTLKSEMGIMHAVQVPWVSGPPLRQFEELAAWGELLKSGVVEAFTAHAKDVWMEGNYWLALICGPAYPVPVEQARTPLLGMVHTAAAHTRLVALCRSTRATSSRLAGSWSKRSGLSSSLRAHAATSCSPRSGELCPSDLTSGSPDRQLSVLLSHSVTCQDPRCQRDDQAGRHQTRKGGEALATVGRFPAFPLRGFA